MNLWNRFVCNRAGHEWSWVYAAQVGVLDRPVCKRCGETA